MSQSTENLKFVDNVYLILFSKEHFQKSDAALVNSMRVANSELLLEKMYPSKYDKLLIKPMGAFMNDVNEGKTIDNYWVSYVIQYTARI